MGLINPGIPCVNEDRLRLLETIIPGIAHEINNHGQTVILTGQVLLEVWEGLKPITDQYFENHGEFSAGGLDYSMLRDELSEFFSNIIHGAQQIERIASAIRDFAQECPKEEHDLVDLNHLVEGTLILLADLIRKSKANVELKLYPFLPKFHGYDRSIKQALLHLIISACRSIQDKQQKIEVSTLDEMSEDTVECKIGHRGTEIPPAKLARIHDFLSGSYPADTYPGLAAVHEIMSVHGGGVEIISETGKGTQISLNFHLRIKGD